MRAAAEVFARRWWSQELGAGGRALAALAMPLSWAWSGLATLIGGLQGRRSIEVENIAVLSVGNLAVGGTGKTPIASWIGCVLKEAGQATAILVGEAGRDEGKLHAQWLRTNRVIRNRDRVAGARRARGGGASVLILDDGFQHRRLRRDLDVVLLAAEDAFPGPTLPCGPYRESPRALRRADLIVVTRRERTIEASRALAELVEAHAPGRVVAGAEITPAGWLRLDGGAAVLPAGDVVAFCGVARPLSFQASVARQASGTVGLVAFPDHHAYTRADVATLAEASGGLPLVTTEKDAVKLREYADGLPDTYVMKEDVLWDWGEQSLRERLEAAVQRVRRT